MIKYLLFAILGAAFLFRFVGIAYGLPFALVGDETPLVFGALKMLELKTVIPAFHMDEFKNILYFPPYLSYLYLAPFAALTGLKFLFFNGSFLEFKNFLIVDSSQFFIIARFLSVLFGTATVWLVYKIGKNLFKNETAGLFSAAFLSLSFLHVNFSHWARHWIPAVFFFSLVIYVLSRPDYSAKKKYLLASLAAGIGIGINYQAGLSALFILLWFICRSRLLRGCLKEKWVYGAAVLFAGLAVLAFLLYPAGLVVKGENISGPERSVSGFLAGYAFYFFQMLKTEPAFLLFIILGFLFLFLRERRYFFVFAGFAFFYIAVFYFFFFHMGRYILMLYPVFSLAAGYGLYELREKLRGFLKPLSVAVVAAAFLPMLILVLRFDFLLLKNDTRVLAAEWAESFIPENSKAAVLVDLMRLPPSADAVKEQKLIDPFSLRRIDGAELALPDRFLPAPRYHALNLFAVKSENFLGRFEDYIRSNNYEYILFSPDLAELKGVLPYLSGAGVRIKTFNGWDNPSNDITNGFGGGLLNIFKLNSNGPEIRIIKL